MRPGCWLAAMVQHHRRPLRQCTIGTGHGRSMCSWLPQFVYTMCLFLRLRGLRLEPLKTGLNRFRHGEPAAGLTDATHCLQVRR
jgi:hypothetical protein